MFLSQLKNFLTKKIINKLLSNVKAIPNDGIITTVGIVYDESNFSEREDLVSELIKNGIKENAIKVLVFRDKIKKNEVFDYPVFCNNDMSWSATFDKKEVVSFVAIDFDLLINYYDVEKVPLLLVSHISKAKFKVGFATIDKRLNHFIINVSANNRSVFMEELFKYLKILNKI
jgi:hypothetical protein